MVLLFPLVIIRLSWVMSSSKPLDDLDVVAPIFSAGVAFRDVGSISNSVSDVHGAGFSQHASAAPSHEPGLYEQPFGFHETLDFPEHGPRAPNLVQVMWQPLIVLNLEYRLRKAPTAWSLQTGLL